MFNTKSVVLFVLGMFTFVGAFILSVVAFDTSSFTTGITVGNIELAGLLIRAVETWQRELQP